MRSRTEPRDVHLHAMCTLYTLCKAWRVHVQTFHISAAMMQRSRVLGWSIPLHARVVAFVASKFEEVWPIDGHDACRGVCSFQKLLRYERRLLAFLEYRIPRHTMVSSVLGNIPARTRRRATRLLNIAACWAYEEDWPHIAGRVVRQITRSRA